MRLARPDRFHAFLPKNKSRRRQDRHHRLRDAGFEGAVGLSHHALGQTNEPLHRRLVDRTPKRAGRKLPQQFARVSPPLGQLRRHGFREKPCVILRRDPVLRRHRSLHGHTVEPDPQLPLLGQRVTQRPDFHRQLVLSHRPIAVKSKLMRNAALPGELALKQRLASDAEGEHGPVEVELVLHVAFDRPQIEHQLIPAGHSDAVLRRRDRRHIVGQLQSGAR